MSPFISHKQGTTLEACQTYKQMRRIICPGPGLRYFPRYLPLIRQAQVISAWVQGNVANVCELHTQRPSRPRYCLKIPGLYLRLPSNIHPLAQEQPQRQPEQNKDICASLKAPPIRKESRRTSIVRLRTSIVKGACPIQISVESNTAVSGNTRRAIRTSEAYVL